jgi:hypothetical protein
MLIAFGAKCWHSGRNAARGECEILRLFSAIQTGMTRSDFSALMDSPEFKNLQVFEIPKDSILIRTPLEWGAANWVIWLDFRESRLARARIRTQDSENEKPKGAPPDKDFEL